MADFTDFLAKISQLEENVSIPIPISTSSTENLLAEFSTTDAAYFTTSHGFETGFQMMYEPTSISQFQTSSFSPGADLSTFVDALKQSSTSLKRRVHRKPPTSPGIPLQFFKDTNVPMLPQLSTPDSAQTYVVSENAQPTLATALQQCPAGSIIVLRPGIYQNQYVINKSFTIRAEGEVIFDSENPNFTIVGGEVIFEGISIRHGRVLLNDGKLQLTNCKINTTIYANNNSSLICRGSMLSQKEDNCISLESAYCTLIECDIRDKGIVALKQSSLFLAKCRIENVDDYGVQIDDSLARIEDSNISDTTQSSIIAVGESDVVVTGTQIYQSDKGSFVECNTGAVVKVKNCSFGGECTNIVHVTAAASLLCENLDLKRNCNVENDGLLQLKQCQLFSVTCNGGRLILNGCDILCTSGCGLLSSGFSDVVLDNSTFHNCRSNGIEVSDQTSVTATNCKFTENASGGASISSTSALFKNCLFTSNAIVGAEIVGSGASPVFDNCQFFENTAVDVTCFQETEPTFTSCRFVQAEHLSAAVVGSAAAFNNCSFLQAQQIAIDVSQEATPKFAGCIFEGSQSFAVQCQDERTSAEFERCTFKDNKNTSAVLVFHHSSASFSGCNFIESGLCHIEVREDAHIKLDNCNLAECAGGIGVFVHSLGTADFNRTTIKDIAKAGLFVGSRGKVFLTESEISGCGEVGIAAELQSTINVFQCLLKNNGRAGIQAEGGDITVDSSTIEEHTDFGIYATALATVVNTNNTFNANSKGDTQIG